MRKLGWPIAVYPLGVPAMLAEHIPDLYLVAVGGARVARKDIFVVQKRARRVGDESRRLEMILLDFNHVACMMRGDGCN